MTALAETAERKATQLVFCDLSTPNKGRFINQVMNGDTSVRVAEDINGSALTFAEIKAIASGNPAVMEKVKVDTEVRKLDSLRTARLKRRFEMQQKIAPTKTSIKSNTGQLAGA